MKPSRSDYDGTFEEAIELREQLIELNLLMAHLESQKICVENHLQHVICMLREKA